MFFILAKARYIATTFESPHVEAVIMESATGGKIIVYVRKEDSFYDLIKTGKWLSVKLYARAKSKIKGNGHVYFETRVYPEEAIELDENELERLAEKEAQKKK
jgi:hypothetical protein